MTRIILPSFRLLRAFSHLLWVLVSNGWEMMVWGNVRAGSISLADTSRSFRALVRLGLWLTIGLLIMLLFSGAWRVISPLQPLVFYTDALAGIYAPAYFVPVAVGLLALGWAYVLCSALHAHWAAKLFVLFLFGMFDFSFGFNILPGLFLEVSILLSGLGFSLWSGLALVIQLGGWAVLLALFVFRWRRPVALGLEFPLILLVVAMLFFSSYFSARLSMSALQGGAESSALQLTQALSLISTFLVPFLLIAGVEVAGFGMSLTEAVASRLRHAPQLQQGWGQKWWKIALAALLCIRLVMQWIAPLFDDGEAASSWGAVVIALLLLVIFARARRQSAREELPGWVIPGAALALYGVLFLLEILTFVASALGVAAIVLGRDPGLVLDSFSRLLGFLAEWNEVFVSALAVMAGVGLWLQARLQRRPLPPASLYLFLFSLWLMWWIFTRAGRPLGALSFDYRDFSALMTPALLGILLVSVLARRPSTRFASELVLSLSKGQALSTQTLLHLTAAALLFWLLEFQDFLSDPLSPAFGLLGAQAALLSVSIFLNVMAAGNRFALNAETGRFPRYARSLMYFGYALLTVTSINWLAASHDVSAMANNEQITRNGYLAIGLPLAFWALMAGSKTVMGEGLPPATEG